MRAVRSGLLLLDVESGAAAGQASLRPGDVLVGSGNLRFGSPDELYEAIERAAGRDPGELRLQFLRGDPSVVREVTVRL